MVSLQRNSDYEQDQENQEEMSGCVTHCCHPRQKGGHINLSMGVKWPKVWILLGVRYTELYSMYIS